VVVTVERFVQMRVGAGAGFGVVEVAYQGCFNISGKEIFADVRNQHFLELIFPFAAVGQYRALVLDKDKHMRQLVQQRDEKTIWVQGGIDTDAVIRCIAGRVAVIAQHTLALAGEGEVYGMILKILGHLLKSVGRQKGD